MINKPNQKLGMTYFSRHGPNLDKFGLSGSDLTLTRCINNAYPDSFFKIRTYLGLILGSAQPRFLKPEPEL